MTDNLKTQLRKAEKVNDTLKEELDSTRKKPNVQIDESNRLDEIYDELEQYTRKNSLEIIGVPENAYKSTEELVIRVGEALNVEIKPDDIEISHKLKRKSTTAVIVKFLSHKVKSRLYKQRTKLKDLDNIQCIPELRERHAGRTADLYQRKPHGLQRRIILEGE